MSMEKCLIVAVADDWAIGVKGGLPWHLSEDLKYFKEKTKGFPVIMGRTTYFSLPFRPLKGRKNIVLNLGWDPIPDDVICVNSFEEAYAAAEGAEKCFIMGGASVYRAALMDKDTLYITGGGRFLPRHRGGVLGEGLRVGDPFRRGYRIRVRVRRVQETPGIGVSFWYTVS